LQFSFCLHFPGFFFFLFIREKGVAGSSIPCFSVSCSCLDLLVLFNHLRRIFSFSLVLFPLLSSNHHTVREIYMEEDRVFYPDYLYFTLPHSAFLVLFHVQCCGSKWGLRGVRYPSPCELVASP
jgi:hypothetical protein